ncbi:heptaprenyl diphosphate synthase component 1 [Staphylococcus sp. IVB6246]|uniref:heptaprenyl diphosphate synthase component 1 n=1 Tax=Staphylococcus sp. IVB6246 TaxID=2989772 RepID=UPI0021CF2F22|nr:heptaprenyl diphosphate synthase component 1 [Staphylococcus sp. IVB6246]UXR68734.1 heptaprenyl diphosphate synthase component 1 [Staphylococcus sp. IVB6246]
MQNTYQLLNQQIKQRLEGVQFSQKIHINEALSLVLDSLHIPVQAKLACLSIDTSLKHLDKVSYQNYERDGILIGDLLSAHYYTLLSDINNTEFQIKMSQAIIKINELKSMLQHKVDQLPQSQVIEMIYHIETLLIKQVLDVFKSDKIMREPISELIQKLNVSDMSYLQLFDHETSINLFQQLQEKYTN